MVQGSQADPPGGCDAEWDPLDRVHRDQRLLHELRDGAQVLPRVRRLRPLDVVPQPLCTLRRRAVGAVAEVVVQVRRDEVLDVVGRRQRREVRERVRPHQLVSPVDLVGLRVEPQAREVQPEAPQA